MKVLQLLFVALCLLCVLASVTAKPKGKKHIVRRIHHHHKKAAAPVESSSGSSDAESSESEIPDSQVSASELEARNFLRDFNEMHRKNPKVDMYNFKLGTPMGDRANKFFDHLERKQKEEKEKNKKH